MSIPLPTVHSLDPITVVAPCAAVWTEMRGDERVRHCGRCDRPVFDLSALTTAEVAELFSGEGHAPCVRFYRRPDGRAITADCRLGLRQRVWRRMRRHAGWAATAFATMFVPACWTATQGLPGDITPVVWPDTHPGEGEPAVGERPVLLEPGA